MDNDNKLHLPPPLPPLNKDPLKEYQAAQDFALQADTIMWQIGSILMGGSLVFLSGLANEKVNQFFFYFGLLLINFVLSCWLFFFQGQYQIKRIKFLRINQIEEEFGFRQNYYWKLDREKGFKNGRYRTYCFSGKTLTKVLYIAISLGSISFGLIKLFLLQQRFLIPIVINVLLIALLVITLIVYSLNEQDFKEYIKKIELLS